MADDFFLFDEYLSGLGHERLTKWVDSLWKWVLPQEDILEIETIEDEAERKKKLTEKVRPLLTPLWAFFVALCHALQDGENDLTAEDAYWLGLVDEVMAANLMSVRMFEEFRPDPPSAQLAPTVNSQDEPVAAATQESPISPAADDVAEV